MARIPQLNGKTQPCWRGSRETAFECRCGSVAYARSRGILRYRGGDAFGDTNSREACWCVSHYDPSGRAAIALVCPKCGAYREHTCHAFPEPFRFPWQPGDRVSVSYEPCPGIESGTFAGAVVRTSGNVVRVHLDYGEGEHETIHIAHHPRDGTWFDLEYGVPCTVSEVH